jgi:hypothetical protein
MRAIGANLLLLGLLGAFAGLETYHPGVYYRSVQEDEALEWASFWGFFIAGGVFAVAARSQRGGTEALPWFLAGLALFCFFVAMEEISWGQRIFGHRPIDRIAIVPPPLELAPSMLAMFIIHLWYPWKFTGEAPSSQWLGWLPSSRRWRLARSWTNAPSSPSTLGTRPIGFATVARGMRGAAWLLYTHLAPTEAETRAAGKSWVTT